MALVLKSDKFLSGAELVICGGPAWLGASDLETESSMLSDAFRFCTMLRALKACRK